VSKLLRCCLVVLMSWALQGSVLADDLPPISIGFYVPALRDVPRKDVEVSLRFWIDELGASLNLPFKPIRLYDSMTELKLGMDNGDINFLVATSMGVAQYFAPEELADGFSGQKLVSADLLFITRRAAGIKTMADLEGKRMAILENDELSDVYLETLLMQTWGRPDFTRLAALGREKRSGTLVHRLFFNQADAALVERNAFEAALALNGQIAQQLQVLEDLSFRGGPPHIGLFSSRMAPQHVTVFSKAVMGLGKTPRGRQIMDIYHSDTMVVSRVSDLDPYRRLLAQHRALLAKSAPPGKKKAP
jgi:hypothetical protein